MSFKDFIKELKNGQINKVYLLYGEETYLIDKGCSVLKEMVVKAFPEFNYIQFDGSETDLESLAASCETLPFSADRKLVLVRDLPQFKPSSKKISEEENTDSGKGNSALLDLIKNLPDSTCLVFANYGEVDGRKKLVSEIKKQNGLWEFGKVDEGDLNVWVKKNFEKHGKEIKGGEIALFIQLSGYNEKGSDKTIYNLENEIEKIVHFMGNQKIVSASHIEALAPKSLENDIFKLINACVEGKISESLRIYSDLLLQGESSFAVLALLSKQIRNMFQIKLMLEQKNDIKTIGSLMGLRDYIVKLYIRNIENLNRNRIKKALQNCITTEENVKSGRMEERLAVETLLCQLFE